jgi:hypothetical protein
MRYWSVQQELERQQLINYHNRCGLHSVKQPILYNITATILFGRKPAYFVESRLAIGLNMVFFKQQSQKGLLLLVYACFRKQQPFWKTLFNYVRSYIHSKYFFSRKEIIVLEDVSITIGFIKMLMLLVM